MIPIGTVVLNDLLFDVAFARIVTSPCCTRVVVFANVAR